MRELEFKSKIENNQILMPHKIQSELNSQKSIKVKVIVLIEDVDTNEDAVFQQTTQSQFLSGYADSTYDN